MKLEKEDYRRTLPNLVNVMDHSNLNFKKSPSNTIKNQTMNRISADFNQSIKMQAGMDKMRNTTYWEKGTSAAHFIREGEPSARSREDGMLAHENSTGTKYFGTSKWNSSMFSGAHNTRYDNEDIN